MHTDSVLTELSGKTHDYTVEVTNRFKGIDLIDKVLEELWTEVCNIVQEVVIKTIPKKRNAKRQLPAKQLHAWAEASNAVCPAYGSSFLILPMATE